MGEALKSRARHVETKGASKSPLKVAFGA